MMRNSSRIEAGKVAAFQANSNRDGRERQDKQPGKGNSEKGKA
jgi:hypothetical protein